MKNQMAIMAMLLIVVSLSSDASPFVPAEGYTARSIYSYMTSFSGGLDLYDGRLYVADFMDVNSMNTDGSNVELVGHVPGNNENSMLCINQLNGRVYTAYTPTFGNPPPYDIGYMNEGGFVHQSTHYGVFDAAYNEGQIYLSAALDGDSSIWRYDQTDGTMNEIVSLVGGSGGLAFDDSGNLYCSSYGDNTVLSFSNAQLAGGAILSAVDAIASIDLSRPGFLAFDEKNNLYATYRDESFENHMVQLGMDGTMTAVADGGGKLLVDGNTIYTSHSDWSTFEKNLYAISIPEPSSIALVLMGAVGMCGIRRFRI